MEVSFRQLRASLDSKTDQEISVLNHTMKIQGKVSNQLRMKSWIQKLLSQFFASLGNSACSKQLKVLMAIRLELVMLR